MEHLVNVRNPRRVCHIGKNDMYNNFECAVLEEGGIVPSPFRRKARMRHVYIVQLIAVMSRTSAGRRTGKRWKFISVFIEDLDFADDITLLPSRYIDVREKTSRLADEVARIGLRFNAKKSKVMQVNTRKDQRIEISGEQVEEFVYLDALLDKEGGTTKDIRHRPSKGRQANYRMQRIWGTSESGR